jgi:phosphatidate cytidylyltransferase
MEVYLPMRSLAKRLLTGVVLVVIITGAVLVGRLGFLFLLLLLNGLTLLEFYRLFRSAELIPQKWGGLILSTFLFIALHGVLNHWFTWTSLLVSIPLTFLLPVVELYRKAPHPFHNLAFTFFGIAYISVPLLFFQATAYLPFDRKDYHPLLVLAYLYILWAGDSAALFTGMAFGKHKLFERISPGKTWEGCIGGALATLLMAFLAALFVTERSVTEWMIMAVLIIVTGTYGDLIKSLMKRSLHIKDSGTILPGHGGMLDRFDTLIGSAPFVFLFLLLFAHA